MIKRRVRFLESRLGSSRLVKKTLDYIFPDHWSFLLGEVALYCFLVLVATGVYLTFFFEPSYAHVVYHGDYVPLRGTKMTEAYRSTLDLPPVGEVERRAVRLRHLRPSKRDVVAVVDDVRIARLEEQRQVDAGREEHEEAVEGDRKGV